MTFDDWTRQVPTEIKNDPVWRVEAYRLGLFLSDLAWEDMSKLLKDRRGRSLADQLHRAAGGISSNICEGYSRSTSLDRAKFYEYALGSARESRDWYYKARQVLASDVIKHRLALTTQLVCLLVAMTDRERRSGRKRISRGSLVSHLSSLV